MIKRPQPKGNAPKKPFWAKMPSSSSDPAPTPDSKQQQQPIEYYRNTAEEDADIDETRRQAQNQAKKDWKRWNTFVKKAGGWDPRKPLNPYKFTNVGAYRELGDYETKEYNFKKFLRDSI